MPKVKLTKRVVESAKPNGPRLVLHDTELKGFQCRISSSGRKTYYLYYRTTDGRERRPKIGEHGNITTEQARKTARQWLAAVADGKDPSITRQNKRRGDTVKDFCERYMQNHAYPKKKASSAEEDRLNIKNHVKPNIGNLKIADVTRRDIIHLHQRMRKIPYAANNVLALLSKMFNLAEQWEERPQRTNPCWQIDKYPQHKRERYLSSDELAELSQVLKDVEKEDSELASVVTSLRLLIFTGCRRNEILTLRWEYVDMATASLHLPDSKTGKKTIYLPDAAIVILKNISRLKDNPHVITGAKPGERLINLRKPWLRIRERVTIAASGR